MGEHPVASGGFGDVWKGAYSGRDVAIKDLRVYKRDDEHKVERVARYVSTIHESRPLIYFVFFRSFTRRLAYGSDCRIPTLSRSLALPMPLPPLSIVSEWMPNGDVRHYVKEHPEADRLQLVCHVISFPAVLHGLSRHLLSSSTYVMDSRFFTPTT